MGGGSRALSARVPQRRAARAPGMGRRACHALGIGSAVKSNGHAKAGDWRQALITSKNGPRAILANAITALRHAPEWDQIFQFDMFRQQTMLRGKAPWSLVYEDRQWEDVDDIRVSNWLQHAGIVVGREIAAQSVEIVAKDRAFHPVTDYVKRCTWDADKHALDEWTIKYLGTDDTPFIRAAASKWMISAVARIMRPGCKADCALILEGPQGRGKSTALKALFHPWFTDEIADLGTKDAAMQLPGAWCLEIAELDAMHRSDVAKIKAFMSRTADRFRPAYGARVIEQPRQNVFAGTVNHNEYLRDETGGRRFLPIACGTIDIDGLIAARDQLWAEARDRYFADETWWIDTADIAAAASIEQEARRILDPWQKEVARLVAMRDSVTASEVLDDMNIPIKDQQQLHLNRVASILKGLGWLRRSMRHQGKPQYRYVQPTT